MIWPLLYGLVAISTAAFLPMTAALQREDDEPEPLWSGTVMCLRAFLGLVWPLTAVIVLVAWIRQRKGQGR